MGADFPFSGYRFRLDRFKDLETEAPRRQLNGPKIRPVNSRHFIDSDNLPIDQIYPRWGAKNDTADFLSEIGRLFFQNSLPQLPPNKNHRKFNRFSVRVRAGHNGNRSQVALFSLLGKRSSVRNQPALPDVLNPTSLPRTCLWHLISSLAFGADAGSETMPRLV